MEAHERENHTEQRMFAEARPPERAPSAPRAELWSSVFPETLGIAVTATLLGGLFTVSLLAYYTTERQGEQARISEGQAVANVFAAALGHLVDQDDAEATAALHRLCTSDRAIRSAEWTGPDGRIRCRWPESAGLGPAGATPAAPEGVRRDPQVEPWADGLTVFSAAVHGAGGSPVGSVRLRLASPEQARPGSLLLYGSVVAVVVTLLIYFALYRRLRRHLRPLDAIQRNLHSYAAGLEKEFAALSLSDSLGQVAQAWNHLIEKVAGLRDQTPDPAGRDFTGDALRRFESHTLRSTLDRLPVGCLRFGPDQRVSYSNMAAARLLGHAREALVGMPLAEALDEDVRAPLVGAYTRSVAAMSIDRKRGEEEEQTTLRFTLIPAPASSPDREGLVTIEDVSHLQEADRARDNFLYHVTHELRTPLTNIQAYAETLTGPGFNDEQTRRECYNVIISETRRLSRLVEDILNISQLEVGTARVELGEVDLVRLLRQIVQDHLGSADEKQIDLTLKLAPKVPRIRGDKQRLSVLITNLIGNALKYTPPGGRVDVTLEVHERCVEIAVADTGIGIAPEDQPHVFEKFYRAVSDEVQATAGTGLGLAIAREVARLHGGEIRLHSEPDRGSRFAVELPRQATEGWED
jgi:two-component system phosphate regulon sensor histidine kinase PhoR